MPITLKELADSCNAQVESGDLSMLITAAADINTPK